MIKIFMNLKSLNPRGVTTVKKMAIHEEWITFKIKCITNCIALILEGEVK